jgi:hypothetical protein
MTLVHGKSLLSISFVLALAVASPLAAQKTDIVTLHNGDKITGEIKELDHAKLKYSTDDISTIYIEWKKIARLTSKDYFEVELQRGLRFYGTLAEPARDGVLVVALTASSTDTIDMARVVKITPIKATFWTRLDGNVDVGFSYASANSVFQLNITTTVKYRGQKWSSRFDYSSYWQDTDSTAGTKRNNASLNATRLLQHKWRGLGYVSAESNEELNLDLRTTLGVGGVFKAVQTNSSLLDFSAGPLVTRELFLDNPDPKVSLEFAFGGEYEAFRFDDPELDFIVNLQVIPSITTWGRVRINLDSKLRYELISDFYIGFSVYDAFDSRAGDEGAQNDLNTTLSLGYKF